MRPRTTALPHGQERWPGPLEVGRKGNTTPLPRAPWVAALVSRPSTKPLVTRAWELPRGKGGRGMTALPRNYIVAGEVLALRSDMNSSCLRRLANLEQDLPFGLRYHIMLSDSCCTVMWKLEQVDDSWHVEPWPGLSYSKDTQDGLASHNLAHAATVATLLLPSWSQSVAVTCTGQQTMCRSQAFSCHGCKVIFA